MLSVKLSTHLLACVALVTVWLLSYFLSPHGYTITYASTKHPIKLSTHLLAISLSLVTLWLLLVC